MIFQEWLTRSVSSSGELKQEQLIAMFQKIYSGRVFTAESTVNPNQTTRIRDVSFSKDPGAWARLMEWGEKRLAKPKPIVIAPAAKKDATQEYDEVLKSFKPQFGNMQHIGILNQIGKEKKLREHVQSLQKKRGQLEKVIGNAGKSERDLAKLQQTLITTIKSYAQPESSS